MSYLEYLDLKAHITSETERIMASLNESLDALAADIQTELQQVRDAIAAAQAAVADNAAVEQALADAQGVIDAADARVQQFSTDLKSDDPTPPAV